jgi:stage II sporulation protein AB (anti-sigma F factor)
MDGARFEEIPAALGARLRLRVPPDPQFGRYVREQIMAFSVALDVPDDDLSDFLSAVGEALANAIEHSGEREAIEVSVWLAGTDQLVATVVDRGVGFEPTASAVTEPRLPDDLCERGRGIPIMRTCADLFSIRSAPGRGTAVTIARIVRRDGSRAFQLASG